MSDLTATKRRFRQDAAAARKKLRRGAAAAAVTDGVLEVLRPTPGVIVSAYWSVGDELPTHGCLKSLSRHGYQVALPVVRERRAALEFRLWRPGAAMEEGVHGIPVPAGGVPAVRPQVLLVPLLAFDRRGYRLGYGGGYYDRTLQDLRARAGGIVAIGLAYAGQEVDRVPSDDLDQPLDMVITELGVRRFPR